MIFMLYVVDLDALENHLILLLKSLETIAIITF
jgi:hypothetical protein